MSDLQKGTAEAVEVKEIKVSEVKALLDQGKDRKEIAKHFNKSVAEMARTVWSNPKLKNLKKKAAPSIVLIDDEEVADTEATETVVEEVATTNDSSADTASAPAGSWGE